MEVKLDIDTVLRLVTKVKVVTVMTVVTLVTVDKNKHLAWFMILWAKGLCRVGPFCYGFS